MTRSWLLAIPLSLSVFATEVRAEEGVPRAVVMPFTGPGGANVRTLVVREILDEGAVDLVASSEAQALVRRERLELKRRDDRATLAEALEVGGVLTGSVRKRRGYQAMVAVWAADGERLGVVTWRERSLKTLRKRMPAKAKRQLSALLAKLPDPAVKKAAPKELAKLDPVETEQDEPSSREVVSDREERSARATAKSSEDAEVSADGWSGEARRGGSRPLVRVDVGPRVISRSFEYADVVPAGERTFRYNLPGAPLLVVAAEAYPFAGGEGPLSNVGLRGSFANAFGLRTAAQDGETYEGTARSFSLGVAAHAVLGPMEVGARVDGGQHSFSLGITQNRNSDGPDVAYTFVEPALTFRLKLGDRVSIDAAGGFRFIGSGGELTSDVYLRRVEIGGLNGDATVSWHVTESWDLQLSGSMQRYFAQAKPAEGDPLTYGSAVDVYRQIGLGVAFRLN